MAGEPSRKLPLVHPFWDITDIKMHDHADQQQQNVRIRWVVGNLPHSLEAKQSLSKYLSVIYIELVLVTIQPAFSKFIPSAP